jgi:hypothetical protein
MGRKRGKDIAHEQENEQTIKELKAANRRLKSDNERLKADLATLQEAFNETAGYLKGNTDGISVEKIIEGVKQGNTLDKIKKSNRCEKCGAAGIKDLHVANVGRLILCYECKDRRVVRNEKKEE